MFSIVRYTSLLVVVFGLTSCEECQRVNMSATSIEYLQFVEQMLATDIDCLPPCWQGLVPGVSTQESVMATLASIPFVKHAAQREPSEGTLGSIDWDNTAPHSSLILGQAKFNSEGILTEISFTTSSQHPLQSLQSFGTIVETFGEPDIYSLVPTHDYSCTWSQLIWLDKGLEIHTYPELVGENGPQMNKNTPVGSIVYFTPQQTLEGYLRNIVGLSEGQVQERLSDYQEWTGFNETGSGSNE